MGVSLVLGTIIGSCSFAAVAVARDREEALRIKAQNEYKIQSADLNHNGIPEKFYTIDDKVALIEGGWEVSY